VFVECIFIYPTTTLLSGLRSFSAWSVTLVSIPFYVCLGIDKRLPKAIFLPQLMLIFWSTFQLWPPPVYFESTGYALPVALGQVLLGAAPLVYLRIKSGKQFLLTPKMFAAPFFGLKHTILFVVANVALLPFLLIYMALSLAGLQLDKQTGGFAHLRPGGLRMTEKIYRLDNKEIRLTGMIHIAGKDYFDRVIESISSERTIILAEGVTDQKKVQAIMFRNPTNSTGRAGVQPGQLGLVV
jgi:hypothetical protein